MRKTLVMLLITAVPLIAFSQSKLHYSYDNAGNRVKREIVVKTKSLPDSSDPEYYSEMLSDKDIRIYPNPTEGHLKIEVAGWDNTDQCLFRLYNSVGQLVLSTRAGSSYTELDISSRSNGLYILHITLNGKETSWKIIKK